MSASGVPGSAPWAVGLAVAVALASSSCSHSASGSAPAASGLSPLPPAPARACRPSATAEATTLVSNAAERIASSLIGIAVGVEDRDDRDVQLARLRDGKVLLVGVDDPDRRRHLDHVADTTEAALQLVLLAGQHQDFLLGATLEATGLLHGLQLLEALEALVHGGEVGEHAAQPALVHIRHADAGRLIGDGFLRLLLGADEHDRPTVRDRLLDELVRLVDVGQRLLQVDDVDAVAVGEDEPLHLGIPAPGLMPEVGAAVQQLFHGYNSHN